MKTVSLNPGIWEKMTGGCLPWAIPPDSANARAPLFILWTICVLFTFRYVPPGNGLQDASLLARHPPLSTGVAVCCTVRFCLLKDRRIRGHNSAHLQLLQTARNELMFTPFICETGPIRDVDDIAGGS